MADSGARAVSVEVPGAPAIPGLFFRRYRGQVDVPVMVDVMQRSRDADLFDMVETEEDVASMFEHPVNWSPSEDVLFADVNGETVGLCRCEWRRAYGDVLTYVMAVHLVPEWRGKGLRHAMLRCVEERIRAIARGQPENLPRFYQSSATNAPNHWKALLEEQGYKPHRYNVMMTRPNLHDLPDCPLPAGVEVRPVRPEHYRQIWDACGEAMREEPNFDEGLWSDEGLRQAMGYHIFQPGFWQIAWDGDEVVAGVIPWIDEQENKQYGRNWGYTQGIFTKKQWRNKGLASALVTLSMAALRDHGVSEAALTADTENPSGALKLYEKLGFRVHAMYVVYRKPLKL